MNIGSIIGLCALNLFLVLMLSPLLEGLIRKLTALVHSRIGPPVYQPYLDLMKLLGKEEIVSSESWLFRWTPLISFSAILVLGMLSPLGAAPPLGFAGEVIVFIYLVSLSGVMVIMSGTSSESPYGQIGSAREMMMILTVEPVIAIALITAAVKAKSMAFADIITWQINNNPSLSMIIVAVALFLAIVAQLAKLPFDIVEADQEIMEGPFVEQSGPKLALFKWSFYAKELIFATVFISVFVPWPHLGIFVLDVIILLVKAIILLVLVGVVHAVNPRLRIDQSVQYFGIFIFITFIGLAFALVGS